VNDKGEVITYTYKLETASGIKVSIKSPNNMPLTQGVSNLVLIIKNQQTTLEQTTEEKPSEKIDEKKKAAKDFAEAELSKFKKTMEKDGVTLDVKVTTAPDEPKTPELVAGKEKGEKTVKPKGAKALDEMAEKRKKDDAEAKAAVQELNDMMAEAEKLGIPDAGKLTKAGLQEAIAKKKGK
jgi:hypothetical protein